MNNKIKLLMGILLLGIIIAGAYGAYNALMDSYVPNSLAAALPTKETSREKENTEGLNNGKNDSNPLVEDSEAIHSVTAEEAPNAKEESEEEKIPAPDFIVIDVDGNEVKLSDFFGKPIVVNFWASWCPPCKAELPDFNKLYLELGDEVTFLMVDLVDGQRETVETGKKLIEEYKYQFPVYFDVSQDAAYTYGITSIPTTLFIDAEGDILFGHQGQLIEEWLRIGIAEIYPQNSESDEK